MRRRAPSCSSLLSVDRGVVFIKMVIDGKLRICCSWSRRDRFTVLLSFGFGGELEEDVGRDDFRDRCWLLTRRLARRPILVSRSPGILCDR